MTDGVYRTRSLGVAAEGLPDQYADGQAAKVWEYYIGCCQSRKDQYRLWITDILKRKNCRRILDVACGTGVDSILLVEEGFEVVSTDASDRMLKYALKQRWNRRKEEAFDKWVIEEANWLTLERDIKHTSEIQPGGFDAVICLGNSFAHLPDFEGQQANQKEALRNFYSVLKPGGILLIDHRNYDEILRKGVAPFHNIYYNSEHVTDIKCSTLNVNGRPTMVTLDYTMDMSSLEVDEKIMQRLKPNSTHHFRLSYYPHRLEAFTSLLDEVFCHSASHEILGDFKPLESGAVPAYFIHLIQKPKE